MLAYILIQNGEVEVIPIDINLREFKHFTIRGRRLSRSVMMQNLKYHSIFGRETPVFVLSKDVIDDQPAD